MIHDPPQDGPQQQAWRAALHRAASPEAMQRIARRLVAMAAAGNERAIHELLERGLGRPETTSGLTHKQALRRVASLTEELIELVGRYVPPERRAEFEAEAGRLLHPPDSTDTEHPQDEPQA